MGILETTPSRSCSPGLRRLIVRLGLATEEQIEQAERESPKRKLIAALAACEVLDEDLAIGKISEDLAIESTDLLSEEQWRKAYVAETIGSMEPGFPVSERVLPLEDNGDSVRLAVVDPLDAEAISAAQFVLGKRVRCTLVRERDLLTVLNKLADSQLLDEGDDQHQGIRVGEAEVELIVEPEEDSSLSAKAGSESKPVIRLVNKMLADALEQHASDLHLEPTNESLEVRFRIDGVMQSHLTIPKRLQGYVTTRIKILAGMDITERRRPQDGRFRILLGKFAGGDARVSSVPTPFGEKLVLRLLNTDFGALSLDTIGMPSEIKERFLRALSQRDRMVVVTGPTGSGKSTTLYGAIQHLKRGTTNIITVEDPIEYRVAGITQIQVNSKIGMTFASGLRSILRQDPDIIMLGEIRDLETAEVACQAAQTGHLLLSTLHTNTAPSAVVRLLDLGLEPFVVASSLGAVLSQRLVRCLCKSCAREFNADEKRNWRNVVGDEDERMRASVGCRECDNTGYKGRTGIYSLLVMSDELRELIRSGASETEIEAVARRNGLHSMHDEALGLVREGSTTLDEIQRVLGTNQREDFQQLGDTAAGAESSMSETHEIDLSELEDVDDLRSFFQQEEAEFVFDSTAADGPATAAELDSGQSIAEMVTSFHHEKEPEKSKTVLVVDDDEGVRIVLARILSSKGFTVHQAFDALDAFSKLQDCQPDLVVSDLIMPGFDGEEFIKRLRANAKTSNIPVIMLTGSDSKEHEQRARAAGANEFLSKSVSPQIVVERVQKLLGK